MNPQSQKFIEQLKNYDGRPLRLMEVCGTHTHAIFSFGIRSLLSKKIRLISGPGCPVCVTPADFIDEAVFLAEEKNCIIATFGDLVRVPGSQKSLALSRATKNSEVQVVYSPLDAVTLAEENPQREVVFLSVGFETTTPTECLAVELALKKKLHNFSLLTANKVMLPAYRLLKDSVDAYIYPGHVCAITGTKILEELAEKENISGVVAGFTADDLLLALATIVEKLQEKKSFCVNCYQRIVKPEGNEKAQAILKKYMHEVTTAWRGLGDIPNSGLALKDEFAAFDARKKFSIPKMIAKHPVACRCGEILQGKCEPIDCPVFGKGCTPEHPIGACMVSKEGSCAAFYQYGQRK